ncbi:DddA-like double-stranded DNA deaminase toxin [Streptomyces sp. NPDC006339]|uniref:DddA-like double-stranded DNA deaminase toxin n=1 Tax=Streptomyces sp. NPDC006339 TaxID=3156755 RepID=UPI0033A82D7A
MLSAGLLAGLLGAPTAAAVEPPPLAADARKQVLTAWETGGAGLRDAAEKALLGGEAGIRKFLDEAPQIAHLDNKVDAARLAMLGGPGTRQAAAQAVIQSPDELETFLLYGYEEPLDTDRKAEITRIAALGGRALQDAAVKAVKGTYADREDFLAKGQYEARQLDNKAEVTRLAANGGPAMQAAASAAINGTPEDIVEFLEVGQFTARDRDQEHASVADLIRQAEQAGKQAEDALAQAKESKDKAIESSRLAKEAAQNAAAELAKANVSKDQAERHSKQAASAALAAADAAQEAIGSANAANRAARRAALAAAQTHSAAAAANEAANRAFNAAIATAGDASKTEEARKLAKEARAAAAAAKTSAAAAERAGLASAAAAGAAKSAKSATTNAKAAAAAAEDANRLADAAGFHSTEAQQAAAAARRHAAAADRAADRSEALALRAAAAATAARDAANDAADHATKAADYAEDAANHAGDAATYAAQAQKNADAAKAAATAATTAVTKAKEVFALARETEAADLQTRTEAAVERARTLKTASDKNVSDSAKARLESLALNDTAANLAEEAARPDADIEATAAKGRQLAMQAMKLLGPWHQEAAARALTGTDQDVLDYLRTRWKEANANDVRQSVVDLTTQSPYEAVRTAATQALGGTPEQIEAFYTKGQYEAGRTDMQAEASRLASLGGRGVKEAAAAAVKDGDPRTLAKFLQADQYGARLTDEKAEATRLATAGGPEVKSAALIAVLSSAELLHDFITTGQYMAQRKDDLAANHVDRVKRLLAEGNLIAAKANTNYWRAAEAAAKARHASAEASAASAEAQKSADAAAKASAEAKASADAAEKSAVSAATSARTARSAANQARQDAINAKNSASDAMFSAIYARDAATRANEAADRARASAEAAGKSADEADAEAKAAWTTVRTLAEREVAEALRQAEEERKAQEGNQGNEPDVFCMDILPAELHSPYFPINSIICDDGALDTAFQAAKDPRTYGKIAWELSGLADVEACIKNPTAVTCVMAAVSVTPWGKLKLVSKLDNAASAIKDLRATRRALGCLSSTAANSFPAGTLVLMADGTHRPIEKLKAGDLLTATNPETRETGPRAVTHTIHTPDDRNFTDVTLGDGSTLTSTANHPYWAHNVQAWKHASSLKAGDTLLTPGNSAAEIVRARNWEGLQDAWNLSVDDLHTYYVSTGTTDVLVHNTSTSLCEKVQGVIDKLPTYSRLGDKTYGEILDMDGNPLPAAHADGVHQLMSGEHDDLFKKADELLQSSGHALYPPKRIGNYSIASHTEAKYAAWMKSKGIKHAIVAINNNNGVCNKKLNCTNAVEAILPVGWTLTVYYPGGKKILEGRRLAP